MHIAKQAEHYREKSEAYAAELRSLMLYVKCDKFWDDNMVNTSDIILRIREIQQHIEAAYGSREN